MEQANSTLTVVHDISTFDGWMARVRELLAMHPEGTGLIAGDHGYNVVLNDELCYVEIDDGSRFVRIDANGWPVNGSPCQREAFSSDLGCWDCYCADPEAGRDLVINPAFKALSFIVDCVSDHEADER